MRRPCVIAMLLVAGQARAGGLVVASGSPRSVGRAGTATVGDDGAGALLVNPAAMARRDGPRAQLGVSIVDDELAWQSTTPDAPLARSQAAAAFAPSGAAFASAGGWVFGLGAMTASVSRRSFRPPRDVPDAEELGPAFDYRYAGIAGGLRQDTVTLGVARRLGDSVAVGLALSASRIGLTEVRRMWAGFSGRDTIGSPLQDLELAFDGHDAFVPGAIAGVLVAPADTSLELGASVSWIDRAQIDARAAAFGTRPAGPSVVSDGAIAATTLRQPIVVRAGARYVGDRFALELGGELAIAPREAVETEWRVLGMRIADVTGLEQDVGAVPSRVSQRTHGAARGSLDLELSPGFLWVTTGYAYSVASVGETRQSPSFGDLGGHTVALGLEGTAGGFTFTLGWSRTWSVARSVRTDLMLDNPYGASAGTASVIGGSFDGSIDQVGLVLELELGKD